MPELTPNLGLKKPLGNETVSRATYNENLDILDQKAVKKGTGIAKLLGGTLAERPGPEIPGRYYFAQDKGEIWLDTGTEWVLAAASRTDFTAHLADYANPHQVKAEQVFALGGVPTGTTFPTSPAPYTLFFRTDLNKLFVYLP